jgi:hypothetical protein
LASMVRQLPNNHVGLTFRLKRRPCEFFCKKRQTKESTVQLILLHTYRQGMLVWLNRDNNDGRY